MITRYQAYVEREKLERQYREFAQDPERFGPHVPEEDRKRNYRMLDQLRERIETLMKIWLRK